MQVFLRETVVQPYFPGQPNKKAGRVIGINENRSVNPKTALFSTILVGSEQRHQELIRVGVGGKWGGRWSKRTNFQL